MPLSYNQCCEILNISSGSDEGQIKAAFRNLSKLYHPDKFLEKANQEKRILTDEQLTENQDKYKLIKEAFETLRDKQFNKDNFRENITVSYQTPIVDELKDQINSKRQEQQEFLKVIDERLKTLSEHYRYVTIDKLLSSETIKRIGNYLYFLNSCYLPGNSIAEQNWNKATIEICHNATLLCEKIITAFEKDNTIYAIDLNEPIHALLNLVEMSRDQAKIVLGLKSVREHKAVNSEIHVLRENLYVAGIETANTILQALSSGFSEGVNQMKIERGYHFVPSKRFQQSLQEMRDLAKVMDGFRENKIKDLRIHINNLRWDNTSWRQFKVAAAKLLAAIANYILPKRKKSLIDEVGSKGKFADLSRKVNQSMLESETKKTHKK